MAELIKWLGHASFRFSGEKVVYSDPWKLEGEHEKADIIIVTHDHYDHLSEADVEKLQKENTVIVTTADCARKLSGNIQVVAPGDEIIVDGVKIEAIPAYNPAKKFHPKKNGWFGFVLTLGGSRIYQASDTDIIPEMELLRDIDFALLPVGGTYTMNPEEAALAAGMIRPKVAIPYHYGDIVGTVADANAFHGLCQGVCEVRILAKN